MYGVENNSRVFFAKKGYYKGTEVTITHRDPATGDVWLDDYPTKGPNGLDYGIWANADSVVYKGEENHENNKRRSKQATQKTGREQKKNPHRGKRVKDISLRNI